MNGFKLIAVTCLTSATALADNGVVDFKGFPVGGRIEAFKQKFPSFQCRPVKEDQILCDSYRETYAGFPADIVAVFFVDGKLQSFRVDGVGTDKQSKILAAMKEKYGQPSHQEKQTIQWDLSNGNCQLLWGSPPQFQVACMSNTNTPKSGKPMKNDI